jgi:hypothetical protein
MTENKQKINEKENDIVLTYIKETKRKTPFRYQ